ncbi:hemolysin type calcium-binding protein [Aliiruegeria haliotis]|uniref:Hemolysin type calcium-binding protein n=1 Tax=Aliiruegeria haliotis TaxID=1280846 RepID=A0A2T0RYW7_9RHOB|nr:calcium-binding protein [Aliiruegeria haliotis]PRY26365.1 hemolysin type calcium-binding protein [Aliiruegeria haliotis]
MTIYISPAEAGAYTVYLEFDYNVTPTPAVNPPFDAYGGTQTIAGVTLSGNPYGVTYVASYPNGTGYYERLVKRYHLERPADFDEFATAVVRVGASFQTKYAVGDMDLRALAATGVPGDAFVIGSPGDPGNPGTGPGTDPGTDPGDDLRDKIDFDALSDKFAAGDPSWSAELPKLQLPSNGRSGEALGTALAGALLNYLDDLGRYGVGRGYDEMQDRLERKENLLQDYLGKALDFVFGSPTRDLRAELEGGEASYRDHEKAWRKAKIESLPGDALDDGLKDLGVSDSARLLLKELSVSQHEENSVFADFGRTFRALVASGEGMTAVIGERMRKVVGSGYDDLVVNDDEKFGGGVDRIQLGKGADVFYDGNGRSKVLGGSGNDEIYTYGGADTVIGGNGGDVVLTGGGKDSLSGGRGPDLLDGGRGSDLLKGGAGADTILAGAGQDLLNGGGGRDRMLGGDGRDTLRGGGGNDRLFGGAGGDVFVFQRHAGRDWVKDFEQGRDKVQVNGADFRDLSFERLGFHTVVHWKDEEIVIEGVLPRELSADDFLF